MISHGDWVTAVWASTIPVIILFSILALYLGTKLSSEEESVDAFITGRQRIGAWRLTWAFFAGVLGSWVVTRPGYLAASTGIFGLCTYSVAIGLSVLVLAAFGSVIAQKVDVNASSLGAFFRWRFGPLAQIYIVTLVVFNMSVLILAEYTNMVSIFHDYVDTGYYAILTAIGFLAIVYTTHGGMFTTVIMNQFQTLISMALFVLIAIYLGSAFDRTLPSELTTKQAGLNATGWSTVVIFPLTVLATALFTESNWQRCWAAATPRTLVLSSSLASVLLILVTFLFGMLALLGQWTSPKPTLSPPPVAKISVPSSYHPYYTFFEVLTKSPSATFPTRINNWGGVVTVLMAAILSQSHIAALQTGITGTLSSYFLDEHSPLFVVRTISLIINIPLLGIAMRSINISQIYHLANMLCALTMFPAFIGLAPGLYRWYSGDMMVYSVLIGFAGSTGYGINQYWDGGKAKATALKLGLNLMWWNESYSYKRVVAIVFCSVLGVLITMILGLPFTACNLKMASLSDLVYGTQKRFSNLWSQPVKPEKEAQEELEQKEILNQEPPSVSKAYIEQAPKTGQVTAMSAFGGSRDPSPMRGDQGARVIPARGDQGGARVIPARGDQGPRPVPARGDQGPRPIPGFRPSEPRAPPSNHPSNWQRVVPVAESRR